MLHTIENVFQILRSSSTTILIDDDSYSIRIIPGFNQNNGKLSFGIRSLLNPFCNFGARLHSSHKVLQFRNRVQEPISFYISFVPIQYIVKNKIHCSGILKNNTLVSQMNTTLIQTSSFFSSSKRKYVSTYACISEHKLVLSQLRQMK